jgi:hypothetical protein
MRIAQILRDFCDRQEKLAPVSWRQTRTCSAAWRKQAPPFGWLALWQQALNQKSPRAFPSWFGLVWFS